MIGARLARYIIIYYAVTYVTVLGTLNRTFVIRHTAAFGRMEWYLSISPRSQSCVSAVTGVLLQWFILGPGRVTALR